MSPRISAAYQLIAAEAVLMRAATTYTLHLWTGDPGNQATVSNITFSGTTVTVTTTGAHGLTTGLPSALTGVVSGGGGSHPLQTLLNGALLSPTVLTSTTFTVTVSATPTDTYTSGGVAGGGGEVSGGSYAAQTIVFQASAPAVDSTAQINFVNMPALSAQGSGIPTVYGVVIDSSSNYVDGGATNIVNSPVVAGATVQIAAGQVIGSFT